ncbi:unnamed protein product, partial [Symbiodinium sp. KB8]
GTMVAWEKAYQTAWRQGLKPGDALDVWAHIGAQPCWKPGRLSKYDQDEAGRVRIEVEFDGPMGRMKQLMPWSTSQIAPAGTRCLPERVLRNAYDSPNTFAVHRGKDWAGGSMHYVDLLNRFGERLGFYELLRMLGAPGLGDKEELAAAQDREDQGESKSAGDNAAAAAAANSALHSVPLAERLRYQGDDSGAFAGLLPPPDKAAAEKCQKQQAILVQLLGNEDPSSSSSLGMARPLTAEQLPYEPAGRMAVPHASTLSNVSQIGMLLEVVRAMANMLALPFSRRLVAAVLKH